MRDPVGGTRLLVVTGAAAADVDVLPAFVRQLIALRAGDHAAWQERKLVDRVIERFGLPTTVFELDRSGHAPPA